MKTKVIQDKIAKSLSFFFKGKLVSNKEILEFLKKKSEKFKVNCRISINESSTASINYMIIFQQKGFVPAPKYYYKKDKIFYCQKGVQLFVFFDNRNKIKNIQQLKEGNFIFLKALTKYSNISLKKNTIHHEILTGPSNKKSYSKHRKDINISKAELIKLNRLIKKYL